MAIKITLLVLNFIIYLGWFYFYQKEKRNFDLGSVIILIWVISTGCAVWYYSFPIPQFMYPNITVWPLLYLLICNLYIFYPFCKRNYQNIKIVRTYNLLPILNVISIFFAIISIPPFINLLIRLFTFKFSGSALADMYGTEGDSADLMFLPYIKPFFSIMRHFTQFIVFLFFFNLCRNKVNKYICTGLCLGVGVFFLRGLLGGSRGSLILILLNCAFYFYFMHNMMNNRIRTAFKRLSLCVIGLLIIGIGYISISRLTTMNADRTVEQGMDAWIAQYAGEGIVKFNDMAWYAENTLDGYQTLPVLVSLFDSRVKDSERITPVLDDIVNMPTWVFYTYIGDFVLDFGKIGGLIAIAIMGIIIRYLIQSNKSYISMYRLIILNYFFIVITMGITANVYRGYFIQSEILYVLVLLFILYLLSKLIPSRHA